MFLYRRLLNLEDTLNQRTVLPIRSYFKCFSTGLNCSKTGLDGSLDLARHDYKVSRFLGMCVR